MNKFIIRYFPSLGIMALLAILLVFIFGFNFLMASMMESDEVVYNGQCSVNYDDTDSYSVIMICGEYSKSYESTNSVKLLKRYVLAQKTPTCTVTMGSLTESTIFDCEGSSADTE